MMKRFYFAILSVISLGMVACSDGKPETVEASGDTVEVVIPQAEDAVPRIVLREQVDIVEADSADGTTIPEKEISDSIADLSRQVKETFKLE